ncbi:hypothetical protein AUEXF2481DRAFT_567223 [Aureobasidium subglaciale EXF-2481]|uniref:Uncharacterized protein n=1 Tax=Aureobasidium subglaciale (strain EXF-2481) TaxID=1043005 RepID=A0A074XY95_AURSE|nr:uncharacterized protein AUEXF2481DRAFT_567223 [Aureobasidium subglaciale EXF-2481]KEQ90538.1 hypothetical protein AUEXF2481DRAFT_567223 [Aureobasidium subglaciale EXF-2481]
MNDDNSISISLSLTFLASVGRTYQNSGMLGSVYNQLMAYLYSADFDRTDGLSGHDLRNAKPRWQELNEVSSAYTTSTAVNQPQERKRVSKQLEPSRRITRQDTHVKKIARLGASVSHSHLRARSQIVEGRSNRAKPSTKAPHPDIWAISRKQTCLLRLFALIGITFICSRLLSQRTPWSNASSLAHIETGFEDRICRFPVVSRIQYCGTYLEPEPTLRAHSVRRAIPEVLYALSESPNAVDDVLDLSEETKIGLRSLRRSTRIPPNTCSRPTEQNLPTGRAEAKPHPSLHAMRNSLVSHVASNGIKSRITEADQERRLGVAESTLIAQHMREEIVSLLIDIVTWLEDHINGWDVTKDFLLDRMHRNMVSIDDRYLDIRDKTVDVRSNMLLRTSEEEFQTDVANHFGEWAMVLENMRHELESMGEARRVPFEQAGVFLAVTDVVADDLVASESLHQRVKQMSWLKRFVLWSLPFSNVQGSEAAVEVLPGGGEHPKIPTKV